MNELRQFGEDIWTAEGPLARDMGFTFTTRMAVVKLASGEVWVSSPVPVSYETLEAVRGLGPVRYAVAATPRHVWRLAAWHVLFPEAALWACHRTRLTLQEGPLPLAGWLDDTPPPQWAEDFEQLRFKGNPLLSEVLFLHKKSRTLLVDDLLMANPVLPGRPFQNALFALNGVLHPHGGVAREMQLTFTNRRLARQSLERLLSWDFDRVILAHGECLEQGARDFVERSFAWLGRRGKEQ